MKVAFSLIIATLGLLTTVLTSNAGNIPIGDTGNALATEGHRRREWDQIIQHSQRAFLVGIEEGNAQNLEFVENVVSHLISISATVPNAVLRLFDRPQIGYIDPKLQVLLATNPGQPIPIVSAKSANDMDPNELYADGSMRRMQSMLHLQRGAGYAGKWSEGFLNFLAGKTVDSPTQAAANGFPVPLTTIQDTAASVRLAEGMVAVFLVIFLLRHRSNKYTSVKSKPGDCPPLLL
jgi:hypothetical protein